MEFEHIGLEIRWTWDCDVKTNFKLHSLISPAYPLEGARFGEHFHQLRQRVLRLRLFRDVGDVPGAVTSARRKNCQQTEEEKRNAPAVGHCGDTQSKRKEQKEKSASSLARPISRDSKLTTGGQLAGKSVLTETPGGDVIPHRRRKASSHTVTHNVKFA